MRHFITGGAGFIGSYLTESLLKQGYQTTVYDNLSHSQIPWLERMRTQPNFRFYQGDVLNTEKLRQCLMGSEVIWHLAANTKMDIGPYDTHTDLKNGVLATHSLLEAARRQDVRQLIFASSGAVYGDIAQPPASEDYGPLLPVSLYGAAKLASEALISAYAHLFEFKAWIFRLGNVLGERITHGVIFDFIDKLRQCPDELEILGDGTAEKNYILVEEVIEGMLYAWKHANPSCEIFNLGSSTTTTVKEIAQIVIEEMGLRGVRVRYRGGGRGWPGDQPRVYMDVTRIQKLGWSTRHSSTEAVRIATRRYLGKEKQAEPTAASKN